MKTTAVKGNPGIRIKESGKFIVTKYIGGIRTTREFTGLTEAKLWKKDKSTVDLKVNGKDPTLSGQGEGRNEIFFRDVYAQYLKEGMVSLRKTTKKRKLRRMNKFFSGLFDIRMSEMNGRTVLHHVQNKVLLVDQEKSRRCNFEKELKDLSSVFNWYDEEVTPFTNPVRKKHFDAGDFRPVPKIKRDLPPEAIPLVISRLKPVHLKILKMQFLLGARIGEVCALNTGTVDFRIEQIDLSETIVWDDSKPVHERSTKTDNPNKKDMTPMMKEILLEQKKEMPKGCIFYFHKKGKPLRYNDILEDLTNALRDSGYGDYCGTHIFRYAMGEFAREKEGREVAQATLSHIDPRQTEHYAKLKVNKKVTGVVIQAENLFRRTATTAQPNDNQENANVI